MRLAFLFLAVLSAQAGFQVEHWKYRRAVSGEAAVWGRLALDGAVFAGAREDLADLRVVRDGRELPYVLSVRGAESEEILRGAEMLDRGVTERGLEFTLDLGAAARHNRVRLRTNLQNFREMVRLESSDDRRAWALIRNDAAIFDFTQDGREVAVLDVDYPVSTRRYLRISVPGWKEPSAISGATVSYLETAPATRVLLARAQPVMVEEARRTLATFDVGASGLPVDRIELAVAGAAFHRGIEVETSADGQGWQWAGTDTLARFGGGERLTVRVRETRSRYFRLTIHNGDDAPLQLSGARFYGLERVLRVERAGAGAYLYYGNAAARPPEYDLSRRLPRDEPTHLKLGSEELNPAYKSPAAPAKPWTEQHPALLWCILLASMGLIGLTVWRLLAGLGTKAN